MHHRFGKTIVIDLGGSIVYPDGIDAAFLKRFHSFILKHLRSGTKFIIVIGGGRGARLFQAAAQAVGRVTDEDRDWLGIHTTRLNAHLLRTIFRDVADPVVIDKRGKMKKLKYPVTVASGWQPGWSTDYVSMALAADFGVAEIIVAGKPDHVYSSDPSKHNWAKKISGLSWKEYRRLVPKKWSPGLSAPVDPVASRLGEKEGIAAIIINGKDFRNFERLLKGVEFAGTIIR